MNTVDKKYSYINALKSHLQTPSQCEYKLFDLIKKNIPIDSSDIIAGYYPIKDEINISSFLYRMSYRSTVALPNIKQSPNIDFKEWKIEESEIVSVPGMEDLLEPNKDAIIVIPTIIFVPCVYVSKNGHREGYGRKRYDKVILRLRNEGHKFLAIGVAYDYQLIMDVPFGENDAQLDWVITPSVALQCRQ